MKTNVTYEHGIRVDPKVVHSFTQAKRKREPRTDDCMGEGSGELWEEWQPKKPPVWLGCTHILPNGKRCCNAPLQVGGDLCFVHSMRF